MFLTRIKFGARRPRTFVSNHDILNATTTEGMYTRVGRCRSVTEVIIIFLQYCSNLRFGKEGLSLCGFYLAIRPLPGAMFYPDARDFFLSLSEPFIKI